MRPHRLNKHTPPYLPSSKTHVLLWSGVEGGCGISKKRSRSTLTQAQVNGLTLNLTGPGPSSWRRIGSVRTGWDERLWRWGTVQSFENKKSFFLLSFCVWTTVCMYVCVPLLVCFPASVVQRPWGRMMDPSINIFIHFKIWNASPFWDIFFSGNVCLYLKCYWSVLFPDL